MIANQGDAQPLKEAIAAGRKVFYDENTDTICSTPDGRILAKRRNYAWHICHYAEGICHAIVDYQGHDWNVLARLIESRVGDCL